MRTFTLKIKSSGNSEDVWKHPCHVFSCGFFISFVTFFLAYELLASLSHLLQRMWDPAILHLACVTWSGRKYKIKATFCKCKQFFCQGKANKKRSSCWINKWSPYNITYYVLLYDVFNCVSHMVKYKYKCSKSTTAATVTIFSGCIKCKHRALLCKQYLHEWHWTHTVDVNSGVCYSHVENKTEKGNSFYIKAIFTRKH